jgi:uncharacterized protein
MSHLDDVRRLQRELEDELPATALSVDGRSFSFRAPIGGAALPAGSYVALHGDGATALGHVVSSELSFREVEYRGGEGDSGELTGIFRIRMLEGEGTILGTIGEGGFSAGAELQLRDAPLEPAPPEAVAEFLSAPRAEGGGLEVGGALHAGGAPVVLHAKGFARHSFLCGQSGSGKTYALGVILERLLTETGLRMVIVDPNSDFVRLGELREGVEDADYQSVAGGVRVLRAAGKGGHAPLVLRFGDLDPDAQATILGLDPLGDRGEFALFAEVSERLGEGFSLADVEHALEGYDDPEARPLALRIRNLGVAGWRLWEDGGRRGSLHSELGGDWRCLVVDVGSLASPAQRNVACQALLSELWGRREEREPLLVVIDEAHNVCPQDPPDRLSGLATELAVLIAGEGRKFGLYLFLASQRPAKIHVNVLSQCENLVLMRMVSAADHAHVRDVFSHVPASLVAQAGEFRLGEGLAAGRIIDRPTPLRFGRRLSEEGGGDVPADWAGRRSQ